MPIKVKACHRCHRSYDPDQFAALTLERIEPDDGAETRQCAYCGTLITGNVRHWAQLELRTPAEIARDRHPSPNVERIRFIQGAALVLAVALAALAAQFVWLSH